MGKLKIKASYWRTIYLARTKYHRRYTCHIF